jgi:hypothetical protein
MIQRNDCLLSNKITQSFVTKNPTIDSYGVLVRESTLTKIDYKLITKPCIYYEGGETIDDLQTLVPQVYEQNGIKLRFSRVHLQGNKHFDGGYFVRFVITAKLLKSEYFNGLNSENIHHVIKFINDTGIIEISKKAFLGSIVNDIDICKNYYQDSEKYTNHLPLLKSFVKTSKAYAVKIFQSKDDSDNKGLIYGENRNAGTWSNPFIKFYNKESELNGKSKLFNKTFLFPLIKQGWLTLKDLRRYEISIKNSSHKKSLVSNKIIESEQFKTVGDLYAISIKDLHNIMNSYLGKYYDKIPRYNKGIELSTQDNMLAYMIDLAIKNNASEKQIYDVLELADNKGQKLRMKKRLDRLFSYVTDTEYIKNVLDQNTDFHTFLEYLGIDKKFNASDLPILKDFQGTSGHSMHMTSQTLWQKIPIYA